MLPLNLVFYHRSFFSFHSKRKGEGSPFCSELSKYYQIRDQNRSAIIPSLACSSNFQFLKGYPLAPPHSLSHCHCPLDPVAATESTSLRVATIGHLKSQRHCPRQVFILTPSTFCYFFQICSYRGKTMAIKTHKLYGPSYFEHSLKRHLLGPLKC